MLSKTFLIPVLALALCAGSASATVIATYDTSAAFNSANASLFDINLGTLTSGPTGLTDGLSGILFSDINGQATLLSVTNCGTTCRLQTATSGFEDLSIQIPPTVTALEFYVVLPTGGQSISISGPGATTLNFNGSSTPEFFGVDTDGTATTLTISPSGLGVQVGIDDVEAGPADTQTPEAATMIMIGTGLIFFRLFQKGQGGM